MFHGVEDVELAFSLVGNTRYVNLSSFTVIDLSMNIEFRHQTCDICVTWNII